VQVGVAAAAGTKLAAARPVLGDDHWPECAADQRPHFLGRRTDAGQFARCGIRRRVDVVEGHEQAVARGEAADRGQQDPPGHFANDPLSLTEPGRAENSVQNAQSTAITPRCRSR
jgi:hypothetical protein